MEIGPNPSPENRFPLCESRAVGISVPEKLRWYVAVVANNTERVSYNKLLDLGFETFLPSQEYVSVWKDGRKRTCNRILLPGKLLVHCTERERRKIVYEPFIKRFMVNTAGAKDEFNRRPIAVVPDQQVDVFKYMLGQSDYEISFEACNLQRGTRVRIVRGALMGLIGVVTDINARQSRVFVNIDYVGCASVVINLSDLVLID